MIKILEDGEFPTCETCIFSSIRNSITYCIKKAPNSDSYSVKRIPHTELPVPDNIMRRAFWPIVTSDMACGEGAWLVPVFSNSMSYSDIIIKLKREAIV